MYSDTLKKLLQFSHVLLPERGLAVTFIKFVSKNRKNNFNKTIYYLSYKNKLFYEEILISTNIAVVS